MKSIRDRLFNDIKNKNIVFDDFENYIKDIINIDFSFLKDYIDIQKNSKILNASEDEKNHLFNLLLEKYSDVVLLKEPILKNELHQLMKVDKIFIYKNKKTLLYLDKLLSIIYNYDNLIKYWKYLKPLNTIDRTVALSNSNTILKRISPINKLTESHKYQNKILKNIKDAYIENPYQANFILSIANIFSDSNKDLKLISDNAIFINSSENILLNDLYKSLKIEILQLYRDILSKINTINLIDIVIQHFTNNTSSTNSNIFKKEFILKTIFEGYPIYKYKDKKDRQFIDDNELNKLIDDFISSV